MLIGPRWLSSRLRVQSRCSCGSRSSRAATKWPPNRLDTVDGVDAGDKGGYTIALLFAVVGLAVVGVRDYRQRLFRYYNPLEIRVWAEFGIWHAAVTGKSFEDYFDDVGSAARAAMCEALAQQLAGGFDPKTVAVKFDHRHIRDGVVTTYYVESEFGRRE